VVIPLLPSSFLAPSESLYAASSIDVMSEAPGDRSELWELLYAPESLGFHLEDDPATGYQLRKLCEAELGPYQDIYDLVRERDDMPAPMALFLDPDKCPAKWLPYLAQYVGARLEPQMTEPQRRAEIKQPSSWRRGQPVAIELMAKRGLSGEGWVRIRPRTPVPGHTYIRVLKAECTEPERLRQLLRSEAVPAWELMDFAAIDGVAYTDVAAGWKSYEELRGAFPTYKAAAHMLPDELPE